MSTRQGRLSASSAAGEQWQRAAFLIGERPHLRIGLQQAPALGHVVGMICLEAPGIEANRDVVGERVGAGEIEVDQSGELVAEEEHVVGKEIGVDDALRQVRWPRFFEMRQLGGEKLLQVGLYLVCAGAAILVERPPAADRKRIGAAALEIEAGEMQPRQ